MRQRIAGTAGQPRASPTRTPCPVPADIRGHAPLSRSGPTKSDRRGRPAARARRAGGARRSRRCRSPRSPLDDRQETVEEHGRSGEIDFEDPRRAVHRRGHAGEVHQAVQAPQLLGLPHERVDRRPRSEIHHCAFGLGCQAAGILERSLVDVGEEKPVVAEPFDAGPAHAASGARDDGHAQWSSSRSGLTSRSCLGIPLSAGRLDLKTLDLFCKEVVSWPG